MENKCKIVQDLLPTYIENMTSNETTNFIEEHLKNCSECQKVHSNMKESIEQENLENTETIKKIKKYKKKIKLIRTIFILLLLALPIAFVIKNMYEFYIVRMAYERNTNYKNFESFTLEEYDESIERYDKHYTTYYKDNIMKKYYGSNLLEFYDGENHYCFDNENMTYWIENETVNTTLNIDISILDGTENIIKDNGKISNFEILKFILLQENLEIFKSGFRGKPYYFIRCGENCLYFDCDTFYVERICEKESPDIREKVTEYRVGTENVTYRELSEPDFSKYTLIEK